MASVWRRVIREAEFEEQLAALIPWEPWGDEYLAAAEELLAHQPTSGVLVKETPKGTIWKLDLPPIQDRFPTLYYAFDESTVTLLWIVAFDDLPG